jgi:pimeloyl-ACP methyl ester carboxylesterase
MRTHYAIRLLAIQLAAMGFHVLRFDYHGIGDSSAEVGVGQFDIWLDDVALAVRELVDISGVQAPALVGLRMGALLAVEALAGRGLRAKGLVLWEPVVAGREYLAVLEHMNAQMIAARDVPPRPTDDLLGARYPVDLRAAIQGIHLEKRVCNLDVSSAALVVSEDRPEYGVLLKEMRNRWPDAMYRSMDDPIAWDNLKAAFDARLTGPIVRAVAEAAESLT